jgi:hypothetical protein
LFFGGMIDVERYQGLETRTHFSYFLLATMCLSLWRGYTSRSIASESIYNSCNAAPRASSRHARIARRTDAAMVHLSEMRGRPVGRFLGDMTTPRRPGESLLQFLVGEKTLIARSVPPRNISNGRGSAKSEHKNYYCYTKILYVQVLVF